MEPALHQLRHDLRGKANTMLLCASALPLAIDQRERLEFLDEIALAADRLLVVLDELEATPGHFDSDGNPPPSPKSSN